MILHRRRRQAGQAMVETALIAPVLLLLVVGIMEMSRMAEVAGVMNEGARQAARVGATSSGTWDARGQAMRNEYISVAGRGAITLPASAITITYYDDTDTYVIGQDTGGGYVPSSPCTVPGNSAACTFPIPNNHIRVAASIPWGAAEPLIGSIIGNSFHIDRSATSIVEQ